MNIDTENDLVFHYSPVQMTYDLLAFSIQLEKISVSFYVP